MKLRCYLKWHKWSTWSKPRRDIIHSEPYGVERYQAAEFQVRYCVHCQLEKRGNIRLLAAHHYEISIAIEDLRLLGYAPSNKPQSPVTKNELRIGS